jgi:hypothetical protein
MLQSGHERHVRERRRGGQRCEEVLQHRPC